MKLSIYFCPEMVSRTNIQPEECRRTDHHWTMHTFHKGANCSACGKFLKGLFYQGYRCVRCETGAHRDCISHLPKCGLVHPPELPPRPPLLPLHPPTPSLPHNPSPLLTQSSSSLDLVNSPTTTTTSLSHSNSFSSLFSQRSPRRSSQVVPTSPSSPPLPLNNLNSPCTSNGMMRLTATATTNHHYVNLNHLESYPWYAGEMDRDTATNVLMEANQGDGSFLVRVRPTTGGGPNSDAIYALSLRWKDAVKHMKILVTRDEKLFYLSESRYFKSVVELINWYEHNTLAESFSGYEVKNLTVHFTLWTTP